MEKLSGDPLSPLYKTAIPEKYIRLSLEVLEIALV